MTEYHILACSHTSRCNSLTIIHHYQCHYFYHDSKELHVSVQFNVVSKQTPVHTQKHIVILRMSGWVCVCVCVCSEGVKRGAEDSIHSPSSSPSACAAWEAEGEGHTHLRSFWTPAWWWEWLPGGGKEGGERSEGSVISARTFVLLKQDLSFSHSLLCIHF